MAVSPAAVTLLFSDGQVLTDFYSSTSEWAEDIAIQPNGKIVAAGYTGFQRIDEENAIAQIGSEVRGQMSEV